MTEEQSRKFKETVEKYEQEMQELDKKYQVARLISLEFPQYNILPDDLKLALLIIQKHEGKFVANYEDLSSRN